MTNAPDPYFEAAADRLVNLLSHWLAGHVPTRDLQRRVEEIGSDELGPEQAEAVEELLAELRAPNEHPGALQMIVRETMECLALG